MRSSERYLSAVVLALVVVLSLTTGCGDNHAAFNAPAALNAGDINLIFVVPPDLANDPLGDVDPATANLNDQGLQRSLYMGTYLKQHLLAGTNASGIYVLEPMTHLQTAKAYPDMGAIGFVEQFALLNRDTVEGTAANSFPLNTAYAPGDVPAEVALPSPYVPAAQGLTFSDRDGNNLTLANGLIGAGKPGFYVLSAPWETVRALLGDINGSQHYNLDLPVSYRGPNIVYALSITASGTASLRAFDSGLTPGSDYPTLPASVAASACDHQPYFSYSRTAGVNGVTIPAGINTGQTIYMVRHAEAHPSSTFETGNMVGAGQWRALSLPNFLPKAVRGQGQPTLVYSVDPAQSFPVYNFSYVRPSLTVLPYAIANRLPFRLAASFLINPDAESEEAAEQAKDYFFTHNAGVDLSGETVLLAWEHKHFPLLIQHLLNSYGGTVPAPTLSWPHDDYDSIWTVKLDQAGNLTVDNALCEGIDSAQLPAAAPQF